MPFVTRRSLLQMNLALGAALSVGGARAATGGGRATMADTRNDWGTPSPYLHDPRGPGYVLTSFLFDSLVWKNERGEIVPAVARTWTRDGSDHVFEIDPRARWHDGRPLTADDVAFTFAYTRAHPYFSIDSTMVAEARVEGSARVRITLSRPHAPFLTDVAGAMPILPRHVFEGVDDPARFDAPASLTGSGPFTLGRHDRAAGAYLFRANPAYHLGRPAFDEAVLVSMSPSAAVAALRKGEIDVALNAPVDRLDELRAAGFRLLSYQTGHPVRLKFNHAKGLFADVEARRSVARAIDRDRLAALAYQGEADVWDAAGLRPRSTGEADPHGYDPSRRPPAAATETEIALIAERSYEAAARVVADQLGRAGFRPSLSIHERGAFTERLKAGVYDIAIVSFSMNGDPDVFRRAVLGGRPEADGWRSNPVLNAALTAQEGESDPKARAAALEVARRAYLDDLPAFSTVSPRRAVAGGPRPALFETPGGVGPGVPSALNKLAFLR